MDPDNFDLQENANKSKRTFRSIEMKTLDEILEEARYLDKFQKKVLHIALKYAQDIKIYSKGKSPNPQAPLLMVHGGAGSGKSALINVISQYVHHIMRRDGDDPDCPYVLLSACTGAAA